MDLIGLDLGTGAIKGVCWNTQRGIVRQISERVAFLYPGPGRVEIDPEAFLQQFLRIVSELAAAADSPVKAISFAAASGNTLLCDDNGKPLTKIISWLDTRLSDWLPPEEWQVREATGWPRIATFPLMHLEYFKRTSPQLLASSQVAMHNDFITWQLCGKHLLDNSNASTFYLWDQKRKCWADHLGYYGLTPAQLPEIVPTGSVAGFLKEEFCTKNLTPDTAIVTGSFDHPSAARASGVLEPGKMLLSCGTSWVGFYPVKRREDIPGNELCDTFQSSSGGCWGAMFSVAKIGVEVEEFVCSRYGNIPERYELFNAEALNEGSEAQKMMVSVILRFKARFDQHPGVTKLALCGGPSEGKAWPELISKHLGVPVEPSPYFSYAGAVGAAQIAGGLIK